MLCLHSSAPQMAAVLFSKNGTEGGTLTELILLKFTLLGFVPLLSPLSSFVALMRY